MQEVKNAIFQMRFPQKLWYLLNLRTDVILWGGTGRTILLNYRILQNYLQCEESIFKTTNISSFVRQLNLYGFRKVTSHLQDPLCNSSNPYMHEYVHDYFQFGRPEMLNKITRKALTVRKNMKPANSMYSIDESMYITPLEKARRSFRLALKKAAQDLYTQSSPRDLYSFETDGNSEMYYDDEVEFDWCVPKTLDPVNSLGEQQIIPPPQPGPAPETEQPHNKKITNSNPEVTASEEKLDNNNSATQGALVNFSDDSGHHSNENFANQFLSMPELDAEPTQSEHNVELLAEFDINNECDEGITKKMDNNQTMLNCVLPAFDHDDVSLAEKNDQVMDHYSGEWDQMFNDMMNKGNNQDLETGGEAKDFFSHISKTLDLLNS